MYNRITLVGNLTKDPELRYTPRGTPVATLSLAVNTVISSDQKETLFIDVITFGKTAEHCSEYLFKGRMILVEGRLTERRWEYDGIQRRKFEVLANQVKFIPTTKSNTQTRKPEVEEPVPEEITDFEPF